MNIRLSLLLIVFILASCGSPAGISSVEDEVVEPAEEVAEAEEEVEPEIVEMPDWYRPSHPVQFTVDSVFVAAAAVSSDSADARRIAKIAVREHERTAFADFIFEILEEDGSRNGLSETDQNAANQARNDLLNSLAKGEEILDKRISYSGNEFFFETNGQVRCYIRHAYEKEALYREIRAAIR